MQILPKCLHDVLRVCERIGRAAKTSSQSLCHVFWVENLANCGRLKASVASIVEQPNPIFEKVIQRRAATEGRPTFTTRIIWFPYSKCRGGPPWPPFGNHPAIFFWLATNSHLSDHHARAFTETSNPFRNLPNSDGVLPLAACDGPIPKGGKVLERSFSSPDGAFRNRNAPNRASSTHSGRTSESRHFAGSF